MEPSVRTFDATGGPPAGGHDPLPPLDADPDLVAPAPPGGGRTTLAVLAAELAATLAPGTVGPLEVPRRPGWTVTYSDGIDGEVAQAWAKRATTKKGVDQLRFACIVLANTCTAILKDGRNIGDDDDPVTFRDGPFLAAMGVGRAVDAVRMFYGGPDHLGDGTIIAHSGEVMRAAGYTDDVQAADLDEDPTPG